MSPEERKAFVRRQIEEMWNGGNLNLVNEFFTSDFVSHGLTGSEGIHGPEGYKQYAAAVLSAFPDYHMQIVDQVAEGDRVTTRFVVSGTHKGELEGLPPTGNRVEFALTGVDRFSGGKIAESWEVYDTLGLMQQLGLVMVPGPKLLARMLIHQVKKLRSRVLPKG